MHLLSQHHNVHKSPHSSCNWHLPMPQPMCNCMRAMTPWCHDSESIHSIRPNSWLLWTFTQHTPGHSHNPHDGHVATQVFYKSDKVLTWIIFLPLWPGRHQTFCAPTAYPVFNKLSRYHNNYWFTPLHFRKLNLNLTTSNGFWLPTSLKREL